MIVRFQISEFKTNKERQSREEEEIKENTKEKDISTIYKDKSVDLETGESKPEPKPESKPESEPGSKAESKTEPKAESKPAVEVAVTPTQEPITNKDSETVQTSAKVEDIPTKVMDIKDASISNREKELGKDNDVRKMFFHSILQSSKRSESAFSVSRDRSNSDALKRSRSESDVDGSLEMAEKNAGDSGKDDEVMVGRPRSASSSAVGMVSDEIMKEEDVGSKTAEEAGDDKVFEGDRLSAPEEDTSTDHEISPVDGESTSAADKAASSANKTTSSTSQSSSPTTQKKPTRHHSEDLDRGPKTLSRDPPTKSQSLDLEIGMKSTFIGPQPVENGDHDGISEQNLTDNDSLHAEPSPSRVKTRPYIDVPEFSWSVLHQRLLTELLFAIESDIQVWKTYVLLRFIFIYKP